MGHRKTQAARIKAWKYIKLPSGAVVRSGINKPYTNDTCVYKKTLHERYLDALASGKFGFTGEFSPCIKSSE